jgi:hypothetical protein
MTRKPFFFGKNRIHIKSESDIFSNSELLSAEVFLNNASIANLVSEPNPKGHIFYDVDLLLPATEKPLPDFSKKNSVDIETLLPFDFVFTQPSKTITQKYCVLLDGGYSSQVSRADYSRKNPTPFLTNQPLAKHSTYNSQEYYYLPINIDTPDTELELYLKITLEMPDGTLSAFNYIKIDRVVNMAVYGFNLSPYQVLSEQEIMPAGFFFQILDQNNNAFSERRYLKIQPATDEDLNLVFKNSFGYWDSLTVQGTQSRKIINSRDSINANGTILNSDSDFHRKIFVNIAELDMRLKHYMQELIISNKIFMLEGDFVELKLETNEFEYLNSAELVENATLEFRIATQEKVY